MLTHLTHGDVKSGLCLTQTSGNMNTVDIAVETLAEHHPIERSVKLDTNTEQILLTLHLKILDLSHVGWLALGPGIWS